MNMTDSAETDRLLGKAGDGDSRALEELLERHIPTVRSSVRRRLSPKLRPRVDPSDVVQDTQRIACERLKDYLRRRPMPFRLWLLRTAHQQLMGLERTHLAAQRSVHREVPLPDASSLAIATRLAAKSVSPSENLMRRELSARVRRCLAQLNERDREILMLRIFEGLSNRDAATILDTKPEATKKRFTRALLRLQQLMGDFEQWSGQP